MLIHWPELTILFVFSGDAARKEAAATAEVAAQQQAVMAAVEAENKQEAVVEPSALSQMDFNSYTNRVVSFLARNFYNLKYVALVLAFCINFMLLFYKVKKGDASRWPLKAKCLQTVTYLFCLKVTTMGEDDDDSGSGSDGGSGSGMDSLIAELSGSGSGSGSGGGIAAAIGGGEGSDEDGGSGEEEDDPIEFVHVSEDFFYMAHVMRLAAALHSLVSLAMLIAYYHLKVTKPLQKFIFNIKKMYD